MQTNSDKTGLSIQSIVLCLFIQFTATAAFPVYGQSMKAGIAHYKTLNAIQADGRVLKHFDKNVVYLDFFKSNWQLTKKEAKVSGNPNVIDYIVTFKCTAGNLSDAAVMINFKFEKWSVNNYVMMPAAIYNGNREGARIMNYCPFITDTADLGPLKPQLLSDVPRLNNHEGISRLQLRTGDMSTPAFGFYDPKQKKGYFLLTVQGTHLGDGGIDFEESADRTNAIFTLSAPVVREKYMYRIANTHVPSNDKGASFTKGDTVSLHYRVYQFHCNSIQELYNYFARIRKDLYPDREHEPYRTFSNLFKLQEKKFNSQNFEPKFGYYSVGLRENAHQDWQIGWTGGLISTYPLLFMGNDTTRLNVIRNFDWLFNGGISPSGYFWDTGEKGDKWMGIFPEIHLAKDLHLVRKSGDGLFYAFKQFALMKKMGITVKPQWESGCRQVAGAFVKTWDTYHQFGQYVDNRTGKLIIGGSTSGGIIPAALMLAAEYFKDPKYAKVAKAAAFDYENKYVEKGLIYGGPGDAMQAFDSESCYGLLESYVTLYEKTRDAQWLNDAKDVAYQFTTWVSGYDYKMPANSILGKLGTYTTGTVWANVQNKHAAPGICTHSGVALLRLYRYTGDVFFLNLLKDIVRAIPQYMSTKERPVGHMPSGWISERVSTTDWLEGIGQLYDGSTWAETSMLLTEMEVPGVYIVPDKNIAVAFDQVTVRKLASDSRKFTFEISNPTVDDAVVTLLTEYAGKIFKSNLELDESNWRHIKIGSHQKVVISVDRY